MAVAMTIAPRKLDPRARSSLRAPAFLKPRLSIVIVNYCQWRNTRLLTKQLQKSRVARSGVSEIVIIDNHSPSHCSPNAIRQREGVKVRRLLRNHGFARAANEGCRLSSGGWYLLLNPDVTVEPRFLDRVDKLVRTTRHDPRLGIIGIGIKNTDGSPQPSCGPLPTLSSTLTGLFLPRAQRRCKQIDTETRAPVSWATGCALLIRKECWRDIGGFDEDYFLYYEDVDLCRRATEHGWNVCYEPQIAVAHHSPLHTRHLSPLMRLVTRHALLTYSLKHWSRWQSLVLGGLMWLESGLRESVAWSRDQQQEKKIYQKIRRLITSTLQNHGVMARRIIRETAEQLACEAISRDGLYTE